MMPSPVLLLAFWQLGSGWMLLWGLAAALPILIHLWSRRRYREVTFAAMQFLLAAMRKNSRRILLEQWILLALRAAILLLFALALADPMLSLLQSWGGTLRGGQTHAVLVIDGSYSMDYRRDDKPRFEAAKELARQMVAAAAQGDGFTLVLMSEPPKVVIGDPAFDGQDVLQEIDALAMTDTGASLPATLAEVEMILRQAAKQHPRLAQRRVCFFTDLGRNTWGEITSADCRERIARLADMASLSLVDLGQPGEQNWAVTRLETSQSLVTIAGEATFLAELQSFNGEDLPRQVVELHVDGQQVAEQRLDIAASGRSSALFQFRFTNPGDHSVEVRLAEDRLPVDNHRWLSVPVRESVRVLCIEGRQNEGKHVALALEPEKTDRPRIRVERAAESALLESDLSQYDCVILCNVGRFSPNEASVLGAFVNAGGGLITFLGDQVQADSYNQELASGKSHVLPARLGDLVRESRYRFDPRGYEHPIVAPFRGHERAGLLTTPIWKYFRLAPHENAKTALAFEGGDAAIVEEKIGRGRSLLFATAASSESLDRSTTPPTPWTAISSWPSFPPLVQEMLNLAVSGRTEGRNLQVGDDLAGRAIGATAATPVIVVAPDERSERVPLAFTGGQPLWSYSGTTLSGIYEAKLGPPLSNVQRFALNVNTRESDLERLPADMLPAQFNAATHNDAGVPAPLAGASKSYFRTLLALVLALVLAETVLAWQFGRGSA
jgi:hypothetical protein